jgi:hypothetical protein
VYISDRLRETIAEYASNGTVLLHAPKAAGTSLLLAVEKARLPIVAYERLLRMHTPDCRCTDPICQSGQTHEAQALEGIRSGLPWLLQFGHRAMTVQEADDIPAGMPIVVPMRSNEDRIVSLLRYNCTVYMWGRDLRTYFSPMLTLAWNPRRRSALGNRVTRGHLHRQNIRDWVSLSETMSRYIDSEGNVLWRDWADVALGPGPHALFWYGELLPELSNRDDPRWRRLMPIPVEGMDAWTRDTFGIGLPHANRSALELPGLNLASAVAELRAAAPEIVEADRKTFEMLQD